MKYRKRWFAAIVVITSITVSGILATNLLTSKEQINNDSPLFQVRNSNAIDKDIIVEFDCINGGSIPRDVGGRVNDNPPENALRNSTIGVYWTAIEPWCFDINKIHPV